MSVCQIIFLFIPLHYFILNKIQGILDWKACIMTFECVMTLTQHYLTKVKFTSSSHMVFIRGNQSFVYSSSCYSHDLQFILQIWMININYSRVSKSCNIIFSHSVLWNKHLKIIIRYPFFFTIQDETGSPGLVVGVSINGKTVWAEGTSKFNGVKLHSKFIQRIIHTVK